MAAADWADLVAELDRWGEAGRIATLWWRDDDAVAATPELATLLRIAGGTPVALAVIPALRDRGFGRCSRRRARGRECCSTAGVTRTAASGKKSEYPSGLSASSRQPRLRPDGTVSPRCSGRARCRCSCRRGTASRQSCSPSLAASGIAAVSTIASPTKPGNSAAMPTGLGAIDVHVDLTDWKGGRRFIGDGGGAWRARFLAAPRAGSAMPPLPVRSAF